tara:strand:+ start:225 stop:416 length:192 start_codon:yes stop_codon:yes gene_type:complete
MKIWKFYTLIGLLIFLLCWDYFVYYESQRGGADRDIITILTPISAIATILLGIFLYRNPPKKK